MPDACPFCDVAAADVIARDGPCFAIWTGEPPAGSAMVLPIRHVVAPWDLDEGEWAATHRLLAAMQERLTASHAPDGWNVGWNVGAVGWAVRAARALPPGAALRGRGVRRPRAALVGQAADQHPPALTICADSARATDHLRRLGTGTFLSAAAGRGGRAG